MAKMVKYYSKNVKNYAEIFNFLTKMTNFWTFIKCQKCTGILKIFRRPFSRKFGVFIETLMLKSYIVLLILFYNNHLKLIPSSSN